MLSSRDEGFLNEVSTRLESAIRTSFSSSRLPMGTQIIGPLNAGIYKVNDIYRKILYLKHLYGFPVLEYIKSVILRSLVVVVIVVPIPALLNNIIDKSLIGTIIKIIASMIITAMAIYSIGITSKERLYVKSLIRKFCKRQ